MKRIQSYLPAVALVLVLIAIPMLRPAQAQPNHSAPAPLDAVLAATENGQELIVYLQSTSPGCPIIQQGESLAGAMIKLRAAGLQLKSSANLVFIYEN